MVHKFILNMISDYDLKPTTLHNFKIGECVQSIFTIYTKQIIFTTIMSTSLNYESSELIKTSCIPHDITKEIKNMLPEHG